MPRLNVAAEQVIESSAYGALLERDGNRGPCAAPQNLYQAAGPDEYGRDDSWVADRGGHRRAVGVAPPGLGRAGVGGRSGAGDRGWTASGNTTGSTRSCGSGAGPGPPTTSSSGCGMPACPSARSMQPHRQPDLPQLAFRNFFEEVDHPVIGRSRYSTLPMRFSRGPGRLHATACTAARRAQRGTLGELGLTRSEIDALEADGIIGGSLRPGHLTAAPRGPILPGWDSRQLRSTSSKRRVGSGWSAGNPKLPPGWRSSPPSSAPTSSSTTR